MQDTCRAVQKVLDIASDNTSGTYVSQSKLVIKGSVLTPD
jgi:hypothetical protein